MTTKTDVDDDIETFSTTHDADGTEKQPISNATPPPATDAAAPAAEAKKPEPKAPDASTKTTSEEEEDEAPRPGETPQQTAARTRSRLQLRINKLTADRYTEKGRADRLEQENRELRERVTTKPPADKAAPGATDKPGDPPAATADAFTKPAPKPEDFDDYEKYLDARDTWRDEKRDFHETKRRDEEQARTAATARTQHVRKVVDDFRTRTPDYDAVMARAREVFLPPAAVSAMEESDHGAAIAYHLVKNPADAEAFFSLSPIAQIRRIGSLEARFADEAKKTTDAKPPTPPKPKPATSAPDPIEPIGGAGVSAPRALEDLDTDDYIDEANKRDREARRRR